MSCSLCRVTKTEDHINGGWHKFNQNLFNNGKMPITEDNYLRFEKPKEDAGVVSNSANAEVVKPDMGNHNVNQWHWEHSDYSAYAMKRMSKLMKALDIPFKDSVVKITSATFNGDAFINQRKGKVFCGFEFRVDIKYECSLDGTKYSGSAILPDVSGDDDAVEITAVKTEGGSETASQINSAMRKDGVKHINKAVETFREELRSIAKDPSSYDPHSMDGEEEDAVGSSKKDVDSDSD